MDSPASHRPVAEPLLKLDGVETYYGPLRALSGVSLTVVQGTVTVILGSNGAGKSTLLGTIMGVLDGQPQRGSVTFRGNGSTGWRRRRSFAPASRTFQKGVESSRSSR